MKHKRVEKPAVRREQILSAARAVLIEKGFSEINLDDVAEKAGVAKGTLYLYFSNKQDLYAAVMESLVANLDERLLSAAKGLKDPMARLERTAEELLEFFGENRDVILTWRQVKPQLKAKGAERMKVRFREHIRVLTEMVKPAAEQGLLREHDPALASWLLISLSRMFMMKSNHEDTGAPLRRNAKEVLDLFLHGLGARESSR